MTHKVTDLRVYKSDKRIDAARQAMFDNAAGAFAEFLKSLDATGASPSIILTVGLNAMRDYATRHIGELASEAALDLLQKMAAETAKGPTDAA
jgi:hypothetical protein